MRATRVLPCALGLLAALPGAAWAQAEEGGGGLFDINAGLSVWVLLVFAVLLLILAKFAWRPILEAVETREMVIQSALDEAAARNAEAAQLLAEHREQLADARRQAQELINQGKAAGETVRKEIEEKAHQEAQAILTRAKVEIERERDLALETLRKESVALALAAASRLLKENLTASKDRELVERYLGELEGQGVEV